MKPFENWKFVTEILHVELYCKQDHILALGGFPAEIVTFEATRRVRRPPPLSDARARLSQYTLTESGSRRAAEAQRTSVRPPPTSQSLQKSTKLHVFFAICFATILFMKPFENWKFVTEILHVELYCKQDHIPGLVWISV